MNRRITAIAAAAVFLAGGSARAQTREAELAKQLANPVASLISVPLQSNYDCCNGPSDGYRYTLNVQPVVPVSVARDWNLIVRTIVPIIHQQATAPDVEDASGFGDVTQTFFLSPKSSKDGVTWAVGPAFLWPVGSRHLGAEKWAAGPSVLVLRQQSAVTAGVLANHLWSYAGEADRREISASYLQPFYSYTYPTSTAITVSAEASYDWIGQEWNVPVIAGVSHVYRLGSQRIQLGLQGKVYGARPQGGSDWGLRFNAVLLFPR